MDYIDDLVNQVKATARQAAEGVRDQADAAAKALDEGEAREAHDDSAQPRDAGQLSAVGESLRGTVPKASADPASFRGGEGGTSGGPASRPWRR